MISYAPFFETLENKGMALITVEKKLGLSPRVTAKFRKNENVSLDTIVRICGLLDVPIENVVKVVY